jgi:hypothetical protein
MKNPLSWVIESLSKDTDNVYEIDSPQGLNSIRNDLNGKYILTDNINPDETITPIGDSDAPFEGIIQGNGNTISVDVDVNDQIYGGLIAVNKGEIRNLNMPNCEVTRNGPWIDGGHKRGRCGVGTLVGNNKGIIKECSTVSSVVGHKVGGLVGVNSGRIADCHTQADIVCNLPFDLYNGEGGGICGANVSEGSIERSLSKEGSFKIQSRDAIDETYFGGITGDNQGLIEYCFADVNTDGDYNVVRGQGQICGSNDGDMVIYSANQPENELVYYNQGSMDVIETGMDDLKGENAVKALTEFDFEKIWEVDKSDSPLGETFPRLIGSPQFGSRETKSESTFDSAVSSSDSNSDILGSIIKASSTLAYAWGTEEEFYEGDELATIEGDSIKASSTLAYAWGTEEEFYEGDELATIEGDSIKASSTLAYALDTEEEFYEGDELLRIE